MIDHVVCGRNSGAHRRGFSIVEALIAVSIVLIVLVGIFGLLPYTYGAMQSDTVRAEASASAQKYLDGVRSAVQSGGAVPGPWVVSLSTGDSMSTGSSSDSDATIGFAASCVQPDGIGTSLFDCTVTEELTVGGVTQQLPSLESLVTREL